MGLEMYCRQVTFENGSNALEPGINPMLERFESGRMKVFAPLTEWFEEFNLYHRIERTHSQCARRFNRRQRVTP